MLCRATKRAAIVVLFGAIPSWALANSLEVVPGFRAYSLSADGSTLVGISNGMAALYSGGTVFTVPLMGWISAPTIWSYGVNQDGTVSIGFELQTSPLAERAFRWTAATGPVDIGNLGGNLIEAYAINDAGDVIVGTGSNASNVIKAFRWTLQDPVTGQGVMTELPTLGGAEGRAWGVNAAGDIVVGGAQTSGGNTRAFRWVLTNAAAGTGIISELGVLGTGQHSIARAVNAVWVQLWWARAEAGLASRRGWL